MQSKAKLLTVEEFADALHPTVSSRTVRTLIHEGKINAVRFGERYYLSKGELDRVISECQEDAKQPGFSNAKTMARGLSSTEANKSELVLVKDFIETQKKL